MEPTIRIGGRDRPVRLNARALRLFAEAAPKDRTNNLAEAFGRLFSGDLEALGSSLLAWPEGPARIVWAVIAGADRDGDVDFGEIEYELDIRTAKRAIETLRDLITEAFPELADEQEQESEPGNGRAATGSSTSVSSGPSVAAGSA